MINSLKNVVGGGGGGGTKENVTEQISQERERLEGLLARFRNERATIDKLLAALTTRTDDLKPLGTSLDQITGQAAELSRRLDEIDRRAASLDERTQGRERLEREFYAFKDAPHLADLIAQHEGTELEGAHEEGEWLEQFPSHQFPSQQSPAPYVPSQSARTPHVDARREERAAFDEFRTEIRALVASLTEECQSIRDTSFEASKDARAAVATVEEVGKTMGPLTQLQELSRNTEARVVALNALAEHVSIKTKAIERQEQAVERAVVQANRVNEMVWTMDQQIARLNDAMRQSAGAEDTLARIDQLSGQIFEKLAAAQGLYDQTHAETARLEKHAVSVVESLQAQVATLGLRRKESDSLHERLRAIDAAVGAAESRIGAVTEKERQVTDLMQRINGLATRIEGLTSRSDELTKKQVAVEALHEKFAQFHELAKTTARQIEVLQESRRDLDAARKDIEEFHRSHADIAQLGAKLRSDRDALETFGRRMSALVARAPELEAKVDTILGKLALVEDATRKTTAVNDSVAQLDGQISRVTARVPLVEKVEARLNGLSALNADVDQKVREQLAHRHEIEALVSAHESLTVQLADTEHKLEDVRGFQEKLVPLIAEVREIESVLDAARSRIAGMKLDEAAIVAHQARFEALEASSRTLEAEMIERTQQAHALSLEIERAAGLKEELLEDLDRVENRHGEIIEQLQARESQVAHVEKLFEQFDEQGEELADGKKTIADLEMRLAEIKQAAGEVENDIKDVVSRAHVVRAVKAEVEEVHEISARSKAHLDHVMERSGEIAALKTRLDRLLTQVAATDERIASIDAQRKLVDDVHDKSTAIVQLFDDVRINLETIGEQKAVVEHMGKKVGQLQFVMQEAESTLHSLQQERELAQRIEHGIKQLRKAVRPEEEKKLA